jgi:endoglucanase
VGSVSTFTLTVSKSGTGDGTVISSPTGIDCGPSCSASFDADAAVTLTATPSSGSRFVHWSGACKGKKTCTVAMTSSMNVTAVFKQSKRRGISPQS